MTDDLIARLRSVDVSWSETGEWCAEAADRIEELVADVFTYLIAKAQEPVEIFTGSFAKPLHADERTAWLEKMREEYNARYT